MNYSVTMTLSVEADSRVEAFDKIKSVIEDVAELQISDELEIELFNELGVNYD